MRLFAVDALLEGGAGRVGRQEGLVGGDGRLKGGLSAVDGRLKGGLVVAEGRRKDELVVVDGRLKGGLRRGGA